MRTLIISDLHLTTQFEERKFRYLENLISKYDRVIINGDFWDGYYITFDQFLNSEWKKLFPLLKDKCIYTFGNHDRKEWQDERVNLFSAEQHDIYKFESNGVSFEVAHGQQYEPHTADILITIRAVKPFLLLMYSVQTFFKRQLVKAIGWKLARFPFLWSSSGQITRILTRLPKEREWYIVGHVHIPHLDRRQKFAVSGLIQFGLASYIEVNDKGEVFLVTERY